MEQTEKDDKKKITVEKSFQLKVKKKCKEKRTKGEIKGANKTKEKRKKR